jgi:paraquat-inducible protein B
VSPAGYWKLGLFLVLGVLCMALATVYFGSQTIGRRTIDYFAYFDESVEGITVGSPVRFRGITIGRVAGIGLGPDHRHVEIRCALTVKELRRLRLVAEDEKKLRFALQPDMRAQLQLIGLTGEEVVSIDFFDPSTHPVPDLPFPVPERTIPSTRSTIGRLADSLGGAADRLPALVDSASRAVADANALVDRLNAVDLGGQAGATLHRLDRLLVDSRRMVDGITASHLPEDTDEMLRTLEGSFSQLSRVLEHIDGDRGLVTSAQRATDAMGDLARGSRDVGRQIDATLREVRQTASTIRRLTDAIDRQPDILVKGRARVTP